MTAFQSLRVTQKYQLFPFKYIHQFRKSCIVSKNDYRASLELFQKILNFFFSDATTRWLTFETVPSQRVLALNTNQESKVLAHCLEPHYIFFNFVIVERFFYFMN